MYSHRLRDPAENDQLIYKPPDHPNRAPGGGVSHGGRYLFLQVNKGTDERNLLFFKELKDPMAPQIDAPFQAIVDKFEAEVRIVGSIGSRLFAVTDLNAPRYKIIEIDLTNPSRDHWKEIVPESKDLLEGAELAGGKLVVKYLVDAK